MARKPGRPSGKKTYISPEDFDRALKVLGWNRQQAAKHLHFNRSQITRLANGSHAVSAQTVLLLNYIAHFGPLPRKGWAFGPALFFRQHGAD